MGHPNYSALESRLSLARESTPLGPAACDSTLCILGHVIMEATEAIRVEYARSTEPDLRFVGECSREDCTIIENRPAAKSALATASVAVPRDSSWVHSKTQRIYIVNDHALDTMSSDPGIIYSSQEHPGIYFFRSLIEWQSIVDDAGEAVPRFRQTS